MESNPNTNIFLNIFRIIEFNFESLFKYKTDLNNLNFPFHIIIKLIYFQFCFSSCSCSVIYLLESNYFILITTKITTTQTKKAFEFLYFFISSNHQYFFYFPKCNIHKLFFCCYCCWVFSIFYLNFSIFFQTLKKIYNWFSRNAKLNFI